MKICTKCQTERPIEDFPLRYDKRYHAGTRIAQCRSCKSEYRRKRNEKVGRRPYMTSKEYTRKRNLARYGLTVNQYDALLEKQGGGCAICLKPMPEEGSGHLRLCVDHCHDTGEVRGLLCMRCNTALGALGDSLERLEIAVEYLRNPPARDQD